MRVGLTGGVASGKSTVSAVLRELGAVVIDADQLARDVVAKGTPGLEAVVAEFGEGLLTPEGDLDRPAMAKLVFSDEAARGDRAPAGLREGARARDARTRGRAGGPRRPAAGRGRARGGLRRGRGRRRAGRGAGRADGARPWLGRGGRPVADRGAGVTRGPAGRRDVRPRQHRHPRRAACEGPGAVPDPDRLRRAKARPSEVGRALGRGSAYAAMSGSAKVRSFCSASRSSCRTRSALMPCFAPMSASLWTRPSTRP